MSKQAIIAINDAVPRAAVSGRLIRNSWAERKVVVKGVGRSDASGRTPGKKENTEVFCLHIDEEKRQRIARQFPVTAIDPAEVYAWIWIFMRHVPPWATVNGEARRIDLHAPRIG